MLNLVSILFGILALILGLPTVIPGLGWAWFFILPVAVVGVIVGQLLSKRSGRNFCLVVLALGLIRMTIFGGI